MDEKNLMDTSVEPIPIKQVTIEETTPYRLSWKQTFAALKHRNYSLWFKGQTISLLGTWMQVTAQGFLVYELTHSAAYLGYVGFAAGLPSWLFMMYGGVIADRMPRRKILVITQTTMMIFAFILAALAFTHYVQPWHIVVLAFFLGTANAFDAPARQAFTLELVNREDLTNAIALNSTMFNTATAIGPTVAGITYTLFGPAWCFFINGLSFIGVIIALLMMRIKFTPHPVNGRSKLADLKEGLRYAVHHKMIRTLIMLVAATSLFGMSFTTLLPAWAVKILGGNATTNGLLQSARGVGALTAALFIASLGRFKFKGRLLTYGNFAFPVLMLVFALVHWLPFSLIVLVGVGGALILQLNLANALVQTLVDEKLRGRVMGIYTLGFMGSMPLGALFMGTIAQTFGAPEAVMIGSIICMLVAISIWLFVPKLRTQG